MTPQPITPNNPTNIDNDDLPVGRVLSRREMLKFIGSFSLVAAGGALLGQRMPNLMAAAATPTATPTGALSSCVVRPELTEGPYFVDQMLNRMDIRSDPATNIMIDGAKLQINFRLSDVSNGTCKPLEGAQVDIWHCDPAGRYSGVEDSNSNASEEFWLRGYQLSDADGLASFITVYPGWYQGRAVHIHFKIRTQDAAQANYEFTSQLFFDETFTDTIHAETPYVEKGYRTLLNDGDNIYSGGGQQLVLLVTEAEADSAGKIDGYVANFDIALDLTDSSVGGSDSAGGGGAPGGGGPGGGRPGGRPSATATPK
jgi:protocatechuate 3,4-dioxygenase beta subunit